MSLLTGLVSFHKLDGNSNDSHGSANGTDTAITYQAGVLNQGASYDGTAFINDVGSVSTYSFIQNTGQFGISFWLKLSDITRNQYFMGSTPTSAEKGFYIGTEATGEFNINIYRGPGIVLSYSPPSFFTDTNWNHVVITGDGVDAKVYKNGSYFGTSFPFLNFGSFSSGDSTRTLRFGDIQNYGLARLIGMEDEIGFWNRELTASEISELYNGGLGLGYPFSSGNSNFLQFFK